MRRTKIRRIRRFRRLSRRRRGIIGRRRRLIRGGFAY